MQIRSTAVVDVILGVIGYIVGMIVVLILGGTAAHAQTTFWVEGRTFLSQGQAINRASALISAPIKERFGIFAWIQTDKNYGQAYGGLTFSPKSWIQFAGGPGIEQDDNPWRVGGYIWLGKDRTSLLFIPEYGGSGFWMKTELNQSLNSLIGIGLISERFKGTGPRVEFNVPALKMKLWAAPLWEKGSTNGLVGIRWNFPG